MRYAKVPEFWAEELKPTQLRVMTALAVHDNPENGCFPSVETLSKQTSIRETHIYSAIRSLEREGFLRREKQRRRTYYRLARTTRFVSDSDETRHENRRDSSVALMYVEQQREQQNEQTAQAPAFIGPAEDQMGKIVGPVSRQPPSSADPPSPRPKRQLSPREQTIRELESWFSQKTFAPLDFSTRRMRQWSWLLNRFEDDHELLRTVCLEAFARKHELCTDEFPVWSLQTVWYYVNFKRKDEPKLSHEEVLKRYVFKSGVAEPNTVREYIKVHGVPDEVVRRVFVGDNYRQVYPEARDGS